MVKFISDETIRNALKEDISNGDVTTTAIVDKNMTATALIIAKQSGVMCGQFVAERVFKLLDYTVNYQIMKKDGEKISKGDVLASIYGSARAMLMGERTALNFMQRMSGIATAAAKAAETVRGTKTRICDTRKTAPGLRAFDKYAVLTGGAFNHRFGLFDGILIKDNHIKAAGGIKQAVERARAVLPHTLKIEVETEDLQMVKEALSCGADIIMLDNMNINQIKEAVELIGGRALTEASGNMDEKNIAEIAAAGVDYISMGALTHSVKALDISMKFE
jgi:nicotinate-nucleotide pyrophosphorylase (carboxylating)